MENTINIDLVSRYMKDFWPKHSKKLYSTLYNTFHPSAYAESFNIPSSNFEDAVEIVADAVHEGKKLGLLNSSVDWSDTYHYDSRGNSITKFNKEKEEWVDTKRVTDDDGLPTLHDQLEIMDRTNLDWIHGILLFDVLYDIVDEFKHYCGENGIDESGMGECMDEFPPYGANRTGTLKQDYYTLFNFMKDLERVGVPVSKIIKPYKLTPIKLVDSGTSDYNEEGQSRIEHGTGDWDNMKDAEEILMDVPNRLEEQEKYSEKEEPTQSTFQKTLKDMGVQLQFVGTFGFGISGMFGMVKDVLEGRYPSLSEGEIILIFLSGLSYLSINLVKDLKEVRQEIDKRGLKEYVNKAVELLKDFENISLKVVEKAGYTVSSLSELLGYTFLLVPILDVTNKLIQENGFDVISLASYLKGALISVGIFYIRNLFNSLVLRLRDKRERKQIYGDDYEVDDNAEDEMVEEGMVVGKVLSERFKGSRVMTNERIGKLSLIDESKSNKNLKWLVEQENKINWLNIPLSKSLEKVDIKNLNNNQSILELNIINNRLVKEVKLHEEVYMAKISEKATTDVVKEIFDIVKIFEGGEEMIMLPDYYTDIDGDDYEYGELVFNVELNILETPNEDNFSIDAYMGGEFNDTIYVDISLSPTFNEKYYESLYLVLSEYVRHEIEHILQELDPDRPNLPDEDLTQKSLNLTPFEYYTQDHELDAQKVGFERRAKMEDKSVEEVIGDYLEYRQHIDKLSDGEKQELISRLTT
jgi:hypothetical protein